MNFNPAYRQMQERAADAYMRPQDADLTVLERTAQRLAFLAGWDAAKRDSHQARQAKRDDLAHELLADDHDTPEGDNHE